MRDAFSRRYEQPLEAIERALQDEDRGVLVDYGLAPAAACIGSDQLALDRRGGEPLVPECDWQFGQSNEVARERARRAPVDHCRS